MTGSLSQTTYELNADQLLNKLSEHNPLDVTNSEVSAPKETTFCGKVWIDITACCDKVAGWWDANNVEIILGVIIALGVLFAVCGIVTLALHFTIALAALSAATVAVLGVAKIAAFVATMISGGAAVTVLGGCLIAMSCNK